MPKRGPAKKPEADQRKIRVSVYLTEAEYSKLLGYVNKPAHISQYIRACALNYKTQCKIPKLNSEAWGHLGKLTGGLNSIAKAARENTMQNFTEQDKVAVEKLLKEVKKLRNELMGIKYER